MLLGIFVLIIVFFVVYFIVELIDKYIVYGSGRRLHLKKFVGYSLIIYLFSSFFFASYPTGNFILKDEGEVVRSYNSDDARVVKEINEVVFVDDFGWMFISRLETTDNQQFRLYYRTLGIKSIDFHDLDVRIVDSSDITYEYKGSGMHAALIISSGVIKLHAIDEALPYADEYELYIGDKILEL